MLHKNSLFHVKRKPIHRVFSLIEIEIVFVSRRRVSYEAVRRVFTDSSVLAFLSFSEIAPAVSFSNEMNLGSFFCGRRNRIPVIAMDPIATSFSFRIGAAKPPRSLVTLLL